KVAAERSLAAERWFGPFPAEAQFFEHMRRFDLRYAEWFEISFQSIVDGILPVELALVQLPSQLSHGGREYRCSYSSIRSGEEPSGILVVITDETDTLAFAREEAAQKELLALCQALARDRSGVLGFFEEGSEMLEQMPTAEITATKRHLHTLKGNAAMLGLSVLSARCHGAEDALAHGALRSEALLPVQERWETLSETLELLLGHHGREHLEVSRSQLQRVIGDAEAGLPLPEVLEELRRWRLERIERPLERLAQHAKGLSERLGKGAVQVEIADGAVLTDPEQSRVLWLSLVHLVRNAVDHGFETPEDRVQAGKSEDNHLRLSASLEGNRVRICIADDGRGVDWQQVRTLAEARGLPSATRADLFAALLAPEFSTRREVSDTSGRGVGLASVDRDLRSLGATLELESELGRGARWTILVPRERLAATTAAPASERRSRQSQSPRRALG
ncbi:MAG TPA: ATP-binding protein, partial [Polyangiaceae bacterium]|nr:ATP-binding protein [Polyangiaceae bacterium]